MNSKPKRVLTTTIVAEERKSWIRRHKPDIFWFLTSVAVIIFYAYIITLTANILYNFWTEKKAPMVTTVVYSPAQPTTVTSTPTPTKKVTK